MIQKFITVGLKGSTDRFSKGLTAGDVIGGITDLADGGITFLGHDGVLLVPGATGAAIPANLGLDETKYGTFMVNHDGDFQSANPMNAGKIKVVKKTYVAPTKFTYALGYNAASGLTTKNINAPSDYTNYVGLPVSLYTYDPMIVNENPLHSRHYETLVKTGDSTATILARLVALVNADPHAHGVATVTNSTVYYGIQLVAKDYDHPIFAKLGDLYAGTAYAMVSGTMGTPVSDLVALENEAKVSNGQNPAPAAKLFGEIPSYIDKTLTYVAYFITFVNKTESLNTEFEIQNVIAVPTTSTALITDMDSILAALAGSAAKTWA